jgi:AraC family transcriptional regulator
LDESKVSDGPRFKGLEVEMHRYPGARVLRVVHPGAQDIAEHRHDWAYVGLYTAGRYREQYDGGEVEMRGPSAVLHPPGRPHADLVGEEGLETLTIEFDPHWLKFGRFRNWGDRSRAWIGGAAAFASRRFAAEIASASADERSVQVATARFLAMTLAAEPPCSPPWLERAHAWIASEEPTSVNILARRLGLHPAYLARAYRHATGEGLVETWRRRRIETASTLLRKTSLPLADIAAASGFCDQSHMNRCFSLVLGRTPLIIRREGELFKRQAEPATEFRKGGEVAG